MDFRTKISSVDWIFPRWRNSCVVDKLGLHHRRLQNFGGCFGFEVSLSLSFSLSLSLSLALSLSRYNIYIYTRIFKGVSIWGALEGVSIQHPLFLSMVGMAPIWRSWFLDVLPVDHSCFAHMSSHNIGTFLNRKSRAWPSEVFLRHLYRIARTQ